MCIFISLFLFVRQWFHRPFKVLSEITIRHNTLDFFLRHLFHYSKHLRNGESFRPTLPLPTQKIEDFEGIKKLCTLVSYMKPIAHPLSSLQKGLYTLSSLEALLRVLFVCLFIYILHICFYYYY
jgi:hypothetical protein